MKKETFTILCALLLGTSIHYVHASETVLFSESFATSQGGFTIINATLPEAFPYIWTFDSQYGMKATAYANGVSYESDSWLVSPAIDMSGYTEVYCSFMHAAKFQNNTENRGVTVWAAENPTAGTILLSEWTQLTVPSYPVAGSWTYSSTGRIGLQGFAGKNNVKIAIRYTSTNTAADTYEMKNFNVVGVPDETPSVPEDGDLLTCAEAQAYALSLTEGETSELTLTVQGYVTLWNLSDGVSFWIADEQGEAKTFQVYKGIMPDGMTVHNGSFIKVTGHITNYRYTAEMVNGVVEIISGGVVQQTHSVSVGEAVAAGIGYGQNKISVDLYAVTGYISAITEAYKSEYGNITFWMSDLPDQTQLLQVYRATCNEELAGRLSQGTRVCVTGKIQSLHFDAQYDEGGNITHAERTVIEIVAGTIAVLDDPTSFDIITSKDSSCPNMKLLRNGQLFILRDGKMYTIQGVAVK